MPVPFLSEVTINQEGINCPCFCRVLPPRDPRGRPEALCPGKLTSPTGSSTSQHPCQILSEGSLPAQGTTKKLLFKWERPFFPALLGKPWEEVKSSARAGEKRRQREATGLAAGESSREAVRGVSPGEEAARTAHAGSAEELVPGRARRCRSGCRRASAGSGRAVAGSPRSRRRFCGKRSDAAQKATVAPRRQRGNRAASTAGDSWGYRVPAHTLCPTGWDVGDDARATTTHQLGISSRASAATRHPAGVTGSTQCAQFGVSAGRTAACPCPQALQLQTEQSYKVWELPRHPGTDRPCAELPCPDGPPLLLSEHRKGSEQLPRAQPAGPWWPPSQHPHLKLYPLSCRLKEYRGWHSAAGRSRLQSHSMRTPMLPP